MQQHMQQAIAIAQQATTTRTWQGLDFLMTKLNRVPGRDRGFCETCAERWSPQIPHQQLAKQYDHLAAGHRTRQAGGTAARGLQRR